MYSKFEVLNAIHNAEAKWLRVPHSYLLTILLGYANKEGWSWPSQKNLAKQCKTSPSQLRRLIKELEEHKVLSVIHRKAQHESNKYKIVLSELLKLNPDGSKMASQMDQALNHDQINKYTTESETETIQYQGVMTCDSDRDDVPYSMSMYQHMVAKGIANDCYKQEIANENVFPF